MTHSMKRFSRTFVCAMLLTTLCSANNTTTTSPDVTTASTTTTTTTSTTTTTTTNTTGSTTNTTSSTTRPTKPTKPIPLTYTITTSNSAANISVLADAKTSTSWNWSKGTSLIIKTSKNIGSIYIVWDKKPALWSLKAGNSTQNPQLYEGGKNGFLHEFVSLEQSGCSFTLTLSESSGCIADIYVFEPGNVPNWVQQWQPILKKADMLVFATHADDELLWFGGTLPVYAGEYHKKVQVAYLIRHGASRSEYVRNHELLNGLWTVGVRNYPMFSEFEDYFATSRYAAMELYDWDAVLGYAVMLLRRFKPDVVIGHDTNGEYGHGVHQLCSSALREAIPLISNAKKYPKSANQYGIWNIKKCYLHLYKKNTIIMDWDVPLKAFGGKTGMDMAKLGYQCHSSQLKKWFRVEGKGSLYDCRKFGLFYTTVGKDVAKNDFFEHVAPVIPITSAKPTRLTLHTPTTTNTTDVLATTTQTQPVIVATTVTATTTGVLPVHDRVDTPGNFVQRLLLAGIAALILSGIAISLTLFLRSSSSEHLPPDESSSS